MPIDLKGELTRPFALILSALAVLGWVLFVLSSWSAASVQKSQRVQILELGQRNETVAAELARQVQASGNVAELERRVAATRDDLGRLTQARNDAQSDLSAAQRSLATTRRDLGEADRSLQNQNQKLADIEGNAEATGTAEPEVRRGRKGGRRWSRRSRQSRAYRVRSR